LVFGICCITVYSLFIIKDKVRVVNYQIDEIGQHITVEKEKIHTLKAELAYLTSPERLRLLSAKYLELVDVQSDQMIKDPLMCDTALNHRASLQIVHNNRPVKWHYKKSSSRYIQVNSHVRNYTQLQSVNNRQ
jgi:hypothetical protein